MIEEFDMFPDDPGLGVFSSEGDLWEVHRRFLLRNLRDFGFGKSAMEQLIMDEVTEVISNYNTTQGQPVTNIQKNLRLAFVNGLWTILTSKRFSHDDPKLLKIATNTTERFNEVFEKGMIIVFLPWLRHIIPKLSGYQGIRDMREENAETFLGEVEKHKAAIKEENLNDFIDIYIAEMRKTTDPKSHFYGERAERNLAYILSDLFVAGSESTATTLAWTILYLCKWPEIQKNLQKELDEVTGKLRNVSISDRQNMPYAVALLDEVFRFSSFAPDGVQHRAMGDTIFHGYFIQKGTWIQPNTYWIHMNPKLWKNPEVFKPERFLSMDKKRYVKNENMQAFGVGRRQCAGETLARDSIFLFVNNLFLNFNMKFDPKEKEPGLTTAGGFLRNPQPYGVIMETRLK